MTARRAACLLLAVMAVCLACEFVFDEDHGADFASEIGSWGASASPRQQSVATVPEPNELVGRLVQQAQQRSQDRRSTDLLLEATPGLRDAPSGLSPPSDC